MSTWAIIAPLCLSSRSGLAGMWDPTDPSAEARLAGGGATAPAGAMRVAVELTRAPGIAEVRIRRRAGERVISVTSDLRGALSAAELRALALRAQTASRPAAVARELLVSFLEVAAAPAVVLGLCDGGLLWLAFAAWVSAGAAGVARLAAILADDARAASRSPALPLATALVKVVTVRCIDGIAGGLRMPSLPQRWAAMSLQAGEVVAALKAQDAAGPGAGAKDKGVQDDGASRGRRGRK